jgi:hypothetical protein
MANEVDKYLRQDAAASAPVQEEHVLKPESSMKTQGLSRV